MLWVARGFILMAFHNNSVCSPAQLWQLYKPESQLESRQCSQWGELGFQGQDPATDFRGMGVLGLDQLLLVAVICVCVCVCEREREIVSYCVVIYLSIF